MDPLSGLRRKNAAAAPTKDGTAGLSAFLPEMQTGNFSECQKIKTICHPHG